ncbi:hypothetical protein [Streptomyces sp. Z26]|uniref:hypothetical protein n=1 Tax=Streptomyces TaxID=1883 RepID=UPI001F0B93A7|nr:hypothetical protein [Streptomyces sp. Z26]
MSDTQRPEGAEPAHRPAAEADAPVPEPVRFFGTTWVDRGGGYALRRAAVVLGGLAGAALGAYALRLAYEGVAIAELGDWARVLLVLVFAVCSAVGFSRTLTGFSHRPDPAGPVDAGQERSMRSMVHVGFIGVLLAYALRALVEAPGEKLRRTEYEEALGQYARRRSARTRNPAHRTGGPQQPKARPNARPKRKPKRR